MSRISSLEMQLANVKSLLRTMCDAVHAGLQTLVQHFEHPNTNRLIKIVVLDSEIDNLERAIDASILQVFATQQPLGYELRLAYACAKIAHHVERIGDAVESLARQLVNGDVPEQKEIFLEMLLDTKNLFERSYTAMFDGDLSLIQEIHILDDKVDVKQRELNLIAKNILKKGNKKSIEKALKIISMSSKLEKIADLCCNWAEQIDFAENGMARRTLRKRKYRLVFIDNIGGMIASLVASFLYKNVKDIVELSVITTQSIKSNNILNFTNLLVDYEITPQIFPIARITTVNWNNCLMLIKLGKFELSEEESDIVPNKTVQIHWPEITIDPIDIENDPKKFKEFANVLTRRTNQLAQIIARTQEQN
ncbi:phosphate signaling complex PhoU family protein [Fluviispira vulneris]|uniref:phosphate signaling complex PhoU family protein n=1 Tax=Fluviispira vulneris TaxID=2763012 RepID=UPI00164448F3|nr:phosphate uptake regulator PhoU [Fluviispira vulneris]